MYTGLNSAGLEDVVDTCSCSFKCFCPLYTDIHNEPRACVCIQSIFMCGQKSCDHRMHWCSVRI